VRRRREGRRQIGDQRAMPDALLAVLGLDAFEGQLPVGCSEARSDQASRCEARPNGDVRTTVILFDEVVRSDTCVQFLNRFAA